MSMFSTIMWLKKMKTRKSATSQPEVAPTSFSATEGLSKKVPLRSRTHMVAGTLGKSSSSCGKSSLAWVLKTTPKTKRSTSSRSKVKKTERMAAAMPFSKVTTSGTARRSRAMRPSLVSRSRRTVRRIVSSFTAWMSVLPPVMPARKTPMGTSQTSQTMRTTKEESKENQKSLRQFFLRLNALNRITTSAVKATQKRCSMTD
mmetsp:Transcript_29049/g.69179  ORF Transcript_29049/g.69179 Transcript_29049/m.69179 type:complete len:202 (+) Transcript_29049:1050-1655(+)